MNSLFNNRNVQIGLIVLLAVTAVFGAYRFAQAGNDNSPASTSSGQTNALNPGDTTQAGLGGSAEGEPACACCGPVGEFVPVEGAAKVEGDIQRISVDIDSAGYNPNTIKLKAGVATEITFAASSGCTAYVQSADLGFTADLTAGPQTVQIKPLEPGTYGFACGMDMVQGQIVVE